MVLRRSSVLALAACLSLPAQEPLRREGSHWVRESRGTITTAGAERLKLITRGRITVRPDSSRENVSYTWTQRVRRSSEQSARDLLDSLAVKSRHAGQWCVIAAEVPDDVIAELLIQVPGSMRQYVFDVHTGSVNVRGLNGDIQSVLVAGNVDMDQIDGNVIARTGGGAMTFGNVKGSLRCLSGGGSIRAESIGRESILETAGGEIWIDRAFGPVRASTAGNIHVGSATASVSVHTSGGMIEVEKTGGIVTAESAGGSIVIGSARGVRAESAGGTIKMKNISGAIRASTASGNLYVALSNQGALEDSFLATGRGDITVYVPSKLPVTVKALNESAGWYGRIISDFPEIQSKVNGSTGSTRPVLAEGSINGGGPVLMLSVSNGSVFLKRQ